VFDREITVLMRGGAAPFAVTSSLLLNLERQATGFASTTNQAFFGDRFVASWRDLERFSSYKDKIGM
jgi:hypothetical protein